MVIQMKRFDIQFRNETSEGLKEVSVSTDDLESLASASWFKEFLGLRNVAREIQGMQREVSDLRMALEEERSYRKQLEMERYQRVQQSQIHSTSESPRPAVVQDERLPQANPQTPSKSSRPGFLDVTPDVMTEAMWNKLSSEQQQQWQQRWLKQ